MITDTLTRPQLRTVEIAGAPRERGRTYGEQARAQIDASVDYYARLFEHDLGLSWTELAGHALSWKAPVEAFAPDLLEEACGIAEGCGRSVGEILALNARGEMVYGNYTPPEVEGCTSFAVLDRASGDGHVYAGQNWDWRAGARESWVVLRVVQPPKPTIVMVVEAGQVGRHGANSAGFAVLSNGLSGFCTPEPRVPQPFIRRRALDQSTFADSLQVIMAAPQQIASNVLLAHRDAFALDLETTPEGHAWLYPQDDVLVHANHYEGFSWARDGGSYKPLGPDSIYRVERLRRQLRVLGEPREQAEIVAHITAGLADHFGHPDAVCAHVRPDADPLMQWQTLTSSVIDLTTGEWWLAAGNPCEVPMQPLSWNLYEHA
jgi:isopenicillin-N N-acyltransferase-like protein